MISATSSSQTAFLNWWRFLRQSRHFKVCFQRLLFFLLAGPNKQHTFLVGKQLAAGLNQEMKYFVELGASPMETLVAATRNGAVI